MKGNRLVRFLDFIAKYTTRIGGISGAACIFLMMLLITIDVVGRNLGTSTKVSFEVSGYMLIAVSFLGLALTQRKGKHIQINILVSRLSQRRQKQLQVVALSVTLVFIGWFTWVTFGNAILAYSVGNVTMTPLHTPLWIPYLLVPIGLGMLAVQLVVDLINSLRQQDPKELPGDTR